MVHLGPTNSTIETKKEEDEEFFSDDNLSYREQGKSSREILLSIKDQVDKIEEAQRVIAPTHIWRSVLSYLNKRSLRIIDDSEIFAFLYAAGKFLLIGGLVFGVFSWGARSCSANRAVCVPLCETLEGGAYLYRNGNLSSTERRVEDPNLWSRTCVCRSNHQIVVLDYITGRVVQE